VFDRTWRAHCDAQARAARADLLQRLHQLWPAVAGARAPSGRETEFHYNVLFDPQNRKGPARLEGQYLRSNHDPHARCTLALPGQTRLRMRADDTGYANLIVTGDWIANDILVPCLEGTVQAGIRAARALSSEKQRYRIIGEAMLTPGRRSEPPRGGPPESPTDPRNDHDKKARRPPPRGEPPQLDA
jgi:hypothetical protein